MPTTIPAIEMQVAPAATSLDSLRLELSDLNEVINILTERRRKVSLGIANQLRVDLSDPHSRDASEYASLPDLRGSQLRLQRGIRRAHSAEFLRDSDSYHRERLGRILPRLAQRFAV